MKKIQHLFVLLIFTAIILISSCKFDPTKGIGWNAEVTAPIASSEVGIFDFNKDSFLQNGQDDLLQIVFRDTVFSAVPSQYVVLPDTSIKQAISLGTLAINSDPIVRTITFGYILRQIMKQGGIQADLAANIYNTPTGQDFLVLQLNNLTSPPYDLDASSFFEYANIQSGFIELKITNRLPMPLTDVIFKVNNKNQGDTIIKDTFPLIMKNQTVTGLYDMSGKYIESALTGLLSNFTIGGGVFPVDTNDYVQISLRAIDLKAHDATASFPNQTVIDSLRFVEYDFGAPIEITQVKLKYGLIKVDAYSTIEDTIRFLYAFESAYDKFGQHPGILDKLPPSQNNIPSHKTFLDTLYDVTLDLRNGPKGFNTYIERIKVDLISSGQLVHFDQTDSLFLYFGLIDLEPNYIEGFIGRDTLVFKGEKAVEAFNKFNVDKIFFEDPKLKLTMINSIGADAQVDIKNIRFKNTKNGKTVDLQSNLIQQPQYLLGPRLPNIGQVSTTEFDVNKTNSNLQEVIAALPNSIAYHARVIANYSGTPGVRNNFLTDTSKIAAFMDFEMPVHGSIENFVLQDTVNVNFSNTVKMQDIEKVDRATLKLILQNQFPFEAVADAVFYDENWNVVQVMANAFVVSAGIPTTNGYVQSPTQTVYSKTFENPEINDLFQRARHLSLHYRFSTKPNNTSVKIYSTYKIKAKLIGDVSYRFGA